MLFGMFCGWCWQMDAAFATDQELEQAQRALGEANSRYFETIVYKKKTPSERAQAYSAEVAPAETSFHKTLSETVQQNLSSRFKLEAGEVSDPSPTLDSVDDYTPIPKGSASPHIQAELKKLYAHDRKPASTSHASQAANDPAPTVDESEPVSTESVVVEEVVFPGKKSDKKPVKPAAPKASPAPTVKPSPKKPAAQH
jgi:hypothetical protein